jgi:hypothetical protein
MHTNGNTIPYVLIADRHWSTEPPIGAGYYWYRDEWCQGGAIVKVVASYFRGCVQLMFAAPDGVEFPLDQCRDSAEWWPVEIARPR